MCKIDIGPHSKQHITDTIEDSGETKHHPSIIIPSENNRHDPIEIQAIQLGITRLTSNTKCGMNIKNIPEGAKEAYK